MGSRMVVYQRTPAKPGDYVYGFSKLREKKRNNLIIETFRN